jgi:ElaB/YqjD/DUF883 family membrane-anchored ribosome-binding protein
MAKRNALNAEIESGLEELIAGAEALIEELQDQKGDAVDNLRSRASATIRNARRRLLDLRPDVQALAARTARTTAAFVRRDPWRAVALGALAVLALGILVSSGGDDDSDED